MKASQIALVAMSAALLVSGQGLAQSKPAPAPRKAEAPPTPEHSGFNEAGRTAGQIVTQPARDVGVAKIKIPDSLAEATQDPYSLARIKTCRQISTALTALNKDLGPDFTPGPHPDENRVGKLAEAGGKMVVNSVLPFRSLVREVSGAAPAQRRYQRALDAGFARRGFLRGVYKTRGCKTPY